MRAYAYPILLTVALVGLSSEAYARSSWCGQFARHNLVNSDPGSKYNLACDWTNSSVVMESYPFLRELADGVS